MCGAAGRRRRHTRIYTFCCPGRSSGRRRTPIPRPLDRIYVGPVLTVSPGPLGTLCCTGLMGAKEIDYVLVGTLVHLFPLVAPLLITAAKKERKKEASARQIRIDNNKIIFRTVFKKTPSECCCIFPRRDHYALLRSSGLRALSLRRSLFVYINLSLSSSSFFFYKGKEKEGNEFVRSAKEEEALVATQSINI